MIEHTHIEIKQKFIKVFNVKSEDLTVWMDGVDSVTVEIETESVISLRFAHLEQLVEFFGTKNINETSHFSDGDCSTCDYGSTTTLTFYIRPDKEK